MEILHKEVNTKYKFIYNIYLTKICYILKSRSPSNKNTSNVYRKAAINSKIKAALLHRGVTTTAAIVVLEVEVIL